MIVGGIEEIRLDEAANEMYVADNYLGGRVMVFSLDTLAFKRTFIRAAIEREYLIFFEHDPVVAAGYIRERDGRKYVEPVEV